MRGRIYWIGVALFIPLVVASVWWSFSVWSECRQTHSVLYCLRLVWR
jgi:hypothetical protein